MQMSTDRSKLMEKEMGTYHRWIKVAVVQLAYSHQQARQWVSKHGPPFTHLNLIRDVADTSVHFRGSTNEVGGDIRWITVV
jgi:hypothetical protein